MRVRFVSAQGTVDADGLPGERLLDAAQRAGQPLEGACDGDMACATCHVVIDAADFPRLSPASAEEEELLDLAPQATRTSRLSCQIRLTDALDGLSVRVP